MRSIYNKGITPIEVLVTFAVLGILVMVVLPQFSSLKERQVLKAAYSDALSAINKSRGDTLASVNSSEYGVHFQSDKVIIFTGTAYSAGAGSNTEIDIVAPASITNVTLGGVSGTSGNLYFSRIYGVPSKTGTIIISTSSYSKTITISSTGAASVN